MLKENRLIQLTIRRGKKIESANFVCYRLKSTTEHAKFCFKVSAKLGNAVRRNQLKRLMRETIRTHKELLPEKTNFVIFPRKGAVDLQFNQITSELTGFITR